jgi:hypothetical protein
MFRLGLVVFREVHTRTTIGTIPTHISYVSRARCVVLCVSCHALVMCCVTPFCDVLRCSDTSIGVVGFVTRSRIREELQSYLVHVYILRTWEGEP